MKRIIISIMSLILLLSQTAFATVQYEDLKDELSSSQPFQLMDIKILQSELGEYIAKLNAFFAESKLNNLIEANKPVDGLTEANFKYQMEILPLFAEYETKVLRYEKYVAEGQYTLEFRDVIKDIMEEENLILELDLALDILYEEQEIMQQQLQTGEVTEDDLDILSLSVSSKELALEQSKRNLENYTMILNDYIDAPYDEAWSFEKEIQMDAPGYSIDLYIETAYLSRLELQSLEWLKDLQDLIIQFYQKSNYLAYQDNYDAMMAAEFKKSQLEIDIEIEKNNIAEEIYLGFNSLEALNLQIQNTELLIAFKEKDYTIIENLVSSGEETKLMLKEAALELFELENQLEILIFEYNTQRRALNFAISYGPEFGGK